MQTANSTLSGEFIGSVEPLPQSHRVDFLVSLFEARREILLALDSGVLLSNRCGLNTEDFEFLLAVDAMSRATAGGGTVSRLQQELGISVATVHRRIRSLCSDSKWLQDPKQVGCIQFSERGFVLWDRLMLDLAAVCESWLSGQNLICEEKNISIHNKILLELKGVIQSQHLSRNGNSRDSFYNKDLTAIPNAAFDSAALNVVIAILRVGRQLSQPCEDLAIRHRLSLNEADILVVLALYLSESIKECSDVKDSSVAEDKIGWDSFFQISRYLVHSHKINTSVFSRCIKHLGDGDGNLGLVQVRSWGGRSKAARVSEPGYRCAEKLWRDYIVMADGLLKMVSDDLLDIGISIHKQVACSVGRFLTNNNTRGRVDEQSWSGQTKDQINPVSNFSDTDDGLDQFSDSVIDGFQAKKESRHPGEWVTDSTAIWSVFSKPSVEVEDSNVSQCLGSFMGGVRSTGKRKSTDDERQVHIQKRLMQENEELRNTIDGLLAIINRFRNENKSLERQFSEIESKHRVERLHGD
jgi:hypothetical protein